jgi:ATP phosphoribosyltransferase
VMLHAPVEALEKITELLPGVEHPSVMPLEGSDRIAIHAVCGETVFWEHLEALKAVGASAILVLPVEKMLA